jgi:general secretion pathway protein A
MIFSHFKLETNPFAEHVSLCDTHMDARFKTALAALVELPTLGDIGILTGRTGTGKTTLLQKLRESWAQNYDVHYLHLGNLQNTGLLRAILTMLGERPRMGKDRMFDQFYAHLCKKQRSLCLLIDEVQLMEASSMTDLRLLGGRIDCFDKLKIILSGQPHMLRTLQMDSLTDFRERVSVNVHLKSLTLPETHAYIEHRVTHALPHSNLFSVMEPRTEVFDDEAVKLIFHHSEGVPRRINSVALKAMINACQAGKTTIDNITVREACIAEQT